MLISLLGLSSERHQEYGVCFLVILTDQVDDGKWATIAGGGIPHLVQMLEQGLRRQGRVQHIFSGICAVIVKTSVPVLKMLEPATICSAITGEDITTILTTR